MQHRPQSRSRTASAGLLLRAARLVLLVLPTGLLLVICLRVGGQAGLVLWLGMLAQALGCALAVWTRQAGRQAAGPAVIMLYVIALSWLMLGSVGVHDWFLYLAQAVLVVVPLGFFADQCLRDSGATALRQARRLAARLAARKDWPADLGACRLLPEVKALRESLHVDASPALELLAHPSPPVRVAALAALEFRPTWRPGQPQVVLQLAQRAAQPEVRAAAVNALGNSDDRLVIEPLAELLCDRSSLVRQAAAEALLWNMERRWGWIRHAVHTALGAAVGQDDGPLKLPAHQATPEALADLHAWTAEKGVMALRAALTLGAYYGQILSAGAPAEVVARLRKHLVDPRTPAMLRLELAQLLQRHRELGGDDLRRLLDPAMPAPVRLIAAEALLTHGNCPEAVAALHDLARLPNREIALATADVVQRRLGVDLGLPRNQPLPALASRSAAEVARRVLSWASLHDISSAGSR
jgi:hypothetical protein